MPINDLAAQLAKILGNENVSTREADCIRASRDASDMHPSLPGVVVWPESTEDVMLVVGMCREHRVPLTAKGTGSSVEGNAIPIKGGLVLDMSRMNAVLEIRAGDLLCKVQPGIICDDLNAALRLYDLNVPMLIGASHSRATIGGVVAKNAVGAYSLKYGGARSSVLGLTAVTGVGEVVRFGHQCPTSSSGYDLTSLIVGSEGTLAVITEVTLALCHPPVATWTAGFTFHTEQECAAAVTDLVAAGVDLAACEYLDSKCIAALSHLQNSELPLAPALLLEVHKESESAVSGTVDHIESILRRNGARVLEVEGDPWALRSRVTTAVRTMHPGTATIRADLAFPLSLFSEVIELATMLAASESVQLYTFGHVGMGILYLYIQESPDDFVRWEVANDVKDHVIEFVVDRGGTCTAGHGVGLGNRRYMQREHGMAVDIMTRVKHAFDPHALLNPGKILP